jgi:hypothetical protein
MPQPPRALAVMMGSLVSGSGAPSARGVPLVRSAGAGTRTIPPEDETGEWRASAVRVPVTRNQSVTSAGSHPDPTEPVERPTGVGELIQSRPTPWGPGRDWQAR